MNIAICAVAKQENDYIDDWIKYHLNLGINQIFLFDNNNSTYEKVEKRIDYSVMPYVKIININDTDCRQLDRYNEFYRKYSKDFDWIICLDIDEFITLETYPDIPSFLSDPKFENFDQVELTWKNYGDGGLVERDMTIPIYESELTPSTSFTQAQVKSFVRGNLPTIMKTAHCHIGINNFNIKSCLADGTPTDTQLLKNSFVGGVYIRHYRTRTLSEYIKNKFNRTDSFFDKSLTTLKYYFRTNPRLPIHDEYLKKAGLLE